MTAVREAVLMWPAEGATNRPLCQWASSVSDRIISLDLFLNAEMFLPVRTNIINISHDANASIPDEDQAAHLSGSSDLAHLKIRAPHRRGGLCTRRAAARFCAGLSGVVIGLLRQQRRSPPRPLPGTLQHHAGVRSPCCGGPRQHQVCIACSGRRLFVTAQRRRSSQTNASAFRWTIAPSRCLRSACVSSQGSAPSRD